MTDEGDGSREGKRRALRRVWDQALCVSRLRIETVESVEDLIELVGGMAGLKDEVWKSKYKPDFFQDC